MRDLNYQKKRDYYLKNRDIILQKRREEYNTNKDRILLKNSFYQIKNKDKIAKWGKEYYNKNREKIRIKQKDYQRKNSKKLTRLRLERIKKDVQFKIRSRLRHRIIDAFTRQTSTGKLVSCKDYRINISEILQKLISTLPKDYKEKEYHIDHIRPLCSFDLTDTEQVIIAFSPDNHQWLTKEENLKKSSDDKLRTIRHRIK